MATKIQSNRRITEKELFERLEQLERSVYVPIVPGEVGEWLDAVVRAVQRAKETVCGYFRTVHPELFQQIGDRDPEQNSRVQDLERDDEEIGTRLQALGDSAEKLRCAVDSVGPDEQRLSKATKELSDRAAALVQRVRKHETEISTWYVEAMLRDRGPVD